MTKVWLLLVLMTAVMISGSRRKRRRLGYSRRSGISNQNHVDATYFSRGGRADFLPGYFFLCPRNSGFRIWRLLFPNLGVVGHVDTGNLTFDHVLVMNVDYFIKKFGAISDDKWTTCQLCNREGQCCVLGHCGERRGVYEGTPESTALRMLFTPLLMTPDQVNDFPVGNFIQKTPKARILAALEYIKTL